MSINGMTENCYDIILDKACLDFVGNNLQKALHEIYKCLDYNGIFYHISTSKPEKRLKLLTDVDYKLKIDMQEISIII
jgi:hypothetical protein